MQELSDESQVRAGRYRVPQARQTLIASHSRLSQALRALGREPHSVLRAENGRPYLPGDNLEFNLSHTHDRAVLALGFSSGLREALGVDLEWIPRKVDYLQLASRFFTESERLWIGSSRPRFFEVWTRKEAVLKSSGLGLRVELDSFEVLEDCLSEEVTGRPLVLRSFTFQQDYQVSLAVATEEMVSTPIVTLQDDSTDWLVELSRLFGRP